MSKLERRYGKDTVSFVGSLPGFASSSNCPAQPQFWANLAADDCGPAEAEGSDDDLRGLEIFLVEDLQGVADALKQMLGETHWSKFPNLQRLVDEIAARPAAQRAVALKDRHKFKTEMDDEARKALFRHMSERVA